MQPLNDAHFSLDNDIFRIVVLSIVKEESESLKDILSPVKDQPWKANMEFLSGMKNLVESLCERFAHRASLFGQYRNDSSSSTSGSKRTRVPPMECKESDFNLAWQTLEQDSK
jgi:hypothetical protein